MKVKIELIDCDERFKNLLRTNLERIMQEGNHRIIFEELSATQIKKMKKAIINNKKEENVQSNQPTNQRNSRSIQQ